MKWALIFACAGCTPNVTDNFNRPFASWVSADVRSFVSEAQACTHFSGEEPYDRQRKAYLDRMIRQTCTGLDQRKINLDRRYGNSKQVRDLISETWSQ